MQAWDLRLYIRGLCWRSDEASLHCVQIPSGIGAAMECSKDKETTPTGMAAPCAVFLGAHAGGSCLQSSQMAACSHPQAPYHTAPIQLDGEACAGSASPAIGHKATALLRGRTAGMPILQVIPCSTGPSNCNASLALGPIVATVSSRVRCGGRVQHRMHMRPVLSKGGT